MDHNLEAIWPLDLFVNVGIQIWPSDHNLEAIWPLDLFVNVGIQIWALDQHGRDLGRQITLEREGRFFAKNWWYIADKSANTGFSGDFLIKLPIYPVSPIFWWFLAKYRLADLSPPFVVSPPADTRYISDIAPIFFRFFPPWLWLCLVSSKSKEKKIKRKSRRKIKKMNLKSIHYFYMVLQRLIFFYYIKIK